MSYYTPEDLDRESKADELGDKIENVFAKYGDAISIAVARVLQQQTVFRLKLKKGTHEDQVRRDLPDVQTRLRLPCFEFHKADFKLYLIVAEQQIKYPHLPELLHIPQMKERLAKLELPFVAGYNFLGQPVTADLVNAPHLLLGGSSNSGKTCGLRALIAGLAESKSPSEVSFVLIDVGATDLLVFKGIPHLACPVVETHDMAYQALVALNTEMGRRIQQGKSELGRVSFNLGPRLVLVIDELPALLAGADKEQVKAITGLISGFLQRGRHAKIHVVLAAQNPSAQNVRVDLSNITARVAFRCAKRNFSEVILGEGGAENLSGQGSLLLKAPWSDGLQQLHGSYITQSELEKLVRQITVRNCGADAFKISLSGATTPKTALALHSVNSFEEPIEDDLLADVIAHALARQTVSINWISTTFHIGWNRASRFMDKIDKWGLVGNVDSKQSRIVIPRSVADLDPDVLDFLAFSGYSEDTLNAYFQERPNKDLDWMYR